MYIKLERTDRAYVLFHGNADEKEWMKRFPGVVGIAFCEDLSGDLYAADGVLSAYDPGAWFFKKDLFQRNIRAVPQDLTDIFFCLAAGQQHFMAAAGAAEPEIHAGSQYQPLPAAAGMRLFHNKKILQSNIHGKNQPF